MADQAEVDQPQADDEEIEGADQLGDAGKRALEAMKAKLAEERRRRRELEPLARKARELEEAQKTEAQKAAEARAAAERERDEARIELLRYKVALAKGLPADLAARLRGGTEEELSKDADELLKLVGSKPASSARPVPDLKSAALPAGEQQIMSGKDVDAWIRRQAGVA